MKRWLPALCALALFPLAARAEDPVIYDRPEVRPLKAPQTLDEWDEAPDLELNTEALAGLSEKSVAAVRRWLTGRCVVSVALVHVPDAPADVSAVERSVKDGEAELLLSARLATRRGENAVYEETRLSTFILGMDVEVAQTASIAVPWSAQLVTGSRVSLQCRPVSGREAVVFISLHHSGEPEIEEVRTSSGTVDLPVVPYLSLFTATKLSLDRDTLVVMAHPYEPGYLAAVLTLVDLPVAQGLPYRLVDLAAHAGNPDVKSAWSVPGAASDRFPFDEDRGLPTGGRQVARDAILSRLEELGTVVQHLGSDVVAISGPEEAMARAERFLTARLAEVELGRRKHDLPWWELVRQAWFDPITGKAEGASLPAGELDFRIRLLTHTPLMIQTGVFRRFLADTDVEIAQAAAIFMPIVGDYVEGESLLALHDPADGALQILQRESHLTDHTRRELSIRKDIEGKRSVERDHLVDLLETFETHRTLRLTAPETTTIRRTPEEARLETWTR